MAKITAESEGVKLVSGKVASVGSKKDSIKFNPLAPSVEDKRTCEKIDGKWYDDYGVCVLVEGPDGGWTAPIKGAYLWYSVTDLEEATGDEELKGKYIADVIGCLVADSSFYPTFAGGCHPILEIDVSYDTYDDPEEAKEDAKDLMLEIAKDIKEGDAGGWGLIYCNPRGKRTTPDDPNAIVSDSCSYVADVLKRARKIKDLSEFIEQDID